MKSFPKSAHRRLTGIALMEVLVIVAIVVALAVVIVPIVQVVQTRSNKAATLKLMQDLGSATMNYCASHDSELPPEDAPGPTTWANLSDPKNANVWFNALPRQMGRKGVGDYASNAAAFYTKDNPLYVPGAPYPTNDTRLVRPIFAVSFNRRLERKSVEGSKDVRLSDVANPNRTVLFLEEGLPKEARTVVTQPHYEGQPKGSARSFVGRYGGKGVLTFCDGHVELVDPNETLSMTGLILTPQTNFVWTSKPEADPNN
jgi:prepilin-type processing-associated H-X9-DG protein